MRHRQKGYTLEVASGFRLDEFKTFFRVSRTSVQTLQNWIVEVSVESGDTSIINRTSSGGTPQKPLGDRLLLMLWYMASQDKYASLADRFGLSESTACCSVRELLEFMTEYLLNKIIVWPSSDECDEISQLYKELRGFDGVIGMIDGSHIPIQKPEIRGVDYYNRKDFYSVILQAVVREDLRFTDIFTGYPGKVHDARVFKNSPLYSKGPTLCSGNRHILGDSAYPNLPWLLVPFKDNGHLSGAQVHFNKVHSSIRSTVERAFALLKGRFKRLHFINQKHISTIVNTIVSACILHNICILGNDDFEEALEVDNDSCEMPGIPPEEFSNAGQEAAGVKRLTIARNL
jgi:hypothetical protein